MPYNSSAFEKQLAKHKAQQINKAIADMPGRNPQAPIDRALPSQQRAIRGAEQDEVLRNPETKQLLRKGQVLELDGDKLVIVQRKRPIYLRAWFLMLVCSLVSASLSPVIFREQFDAARAMAAKVRETTGVDPLSAQTYKDMASGRLGAGMGALTTQTATQPLAQAPTPGKQSTGDVIHQAQERASDVVRQGPGASLEYIQEETRRLNDMAKELDQRHER